VLAGAFGGCDGDSTQNSAESLREKADKIAGDNEAIDEATNEAQQKLDEAIEAAEDESGIPCSVSTDC
jgi:hypothetical protein